MIDIAFPASRIRHYMRVTRRSGQWIMQQSYIALIHKIETTKDCYVIDFYKSRDDGAMLKWCNEAWGPSVVNETWWTLLSDQPQLQLVVRGEERLTQWKLTWE